MLFNYSGPVWSFKTLVVEHINLTTKANSEKEAKRNFEFQAKRELGYDPQTRVSIKPENIRLVEVYPDEVEYTIPGNKTRINEYGVKENFTDGGFWEEEV